MFFPKQGIERDIPFDGKPAVSSAEVMVVGCSHIRLSIRRDGEQGNTFWGFGDISARKNKTLVWQLQEASLFVCVE